MRKSVVILGEQFSGGQVRKSLKSDKYGHQRVRFACAFCPRQETCRFSDLKSGKQGSCGCRRDAQVLLWLSRRASELPAEIRQAIWAHGEVHGLASTMKAYTAVLCQYSRNTMKPSERKAVLNYIWRTEGEKMLSSIAPPKLALIFASIRRCGFVVATAQYGLPQAMALRIFRSLLRADRASTKRKSTISDAIDVAAAGLTRLADAASNRYRGEWYRPHGEFSKTEFSGISRSGSRSLRRAYEILRHIPIGHFSGRSRLVVQEFLNACDRTLKERNLRSKRFLVAASEDLSHHARRIGDPSRKLSIRSTVK